MINQKTQGLLINEIKQKLTLEIRALNGLRMGLWKAQMRGDRQAMDRLGDEDMDYAQGHPLLNKITQITRW